jgi:hypothetical protein
MKQLIALSEFLIGLNLFDANDFDSWTESPDLKVTSKVLSDESIEVCRHSYKGVFYIERYPHKRHDPALLYSNIATWLIEHDTDRFDRTDAQIVFDVQLLDASTSELTIEIDFAEVVSLVLDNAGPVNFDGKKWKVADGVIWVATEGDLINV